MKAVDVLHRLIMERRVKQREPRLHDRGYLAFLRKKPCCVCGKAPPSDACHIRFASKAYGKRAVGAGEKPHDRWAIPMCRECHIKQHGMNEAQFYRERFMLPLLLAQKLYAEYGGDGGKARKRKNKTKYRGDRVIIEDPQLSAAAKWFRENLPSRLVSRPFPKTKRKIKSRGFK